MGLLQEHPLMDVPDILRTRPNWIVWNDEQGRKVPYQVDGKHAKSNDMSTWTTYQAAYDGQNGYSGVGYVFDGMGIFGIDLDGCVDSEGTIQGWAQKTIDAFRSFSELSPSRTGVHIYGLGRLPGSGKKKELDVPACGKKLPGIEIYDRGRYFTFTGLRISETLDVVDCQAELDSLLAEHWPIAKQPAYSPPPKPTTDVGKRAAMYLDKVPGKDTGQGRDMMAFHVACILVKGFDLTVDQAIPLFREWNTKCLPNSIDEEKLEYEIRRILVNANKREGDRGWLLNDRGYEGNDVDLSKLLAGLEPAAPVESEPAVVFPQECIDNMPHLMRLAYDYAMATAIKPQPELTLASLIPLFGAIFGRRVCDDYDTRTNIMTLGLSSSGSGKEHPRQKVKEILFRCGLDLINGPERIGSHAGIISSVDTHPVRLFQLDEIGRLLHTMRDPRASHLYNIGTVLMQLFSSANTVWTGDAYADLKKVKTINQPHVCVYGTSVPDGFYDGLSTDNLSDGMLARLIVFEPSIRPRRRKPKRIEMPTQLIDGIKAWSTSDGGNLSTVNPIPTLVPKSAEADRRHEQYCEEVDAKHGNDDSEEESLWARAPEKAAKLALIHACCEAVRRPPVITIESINWGRRIANYTTRLVLQQAAGNVTARASKWGQEKSKAWKKLTDGMTLREFGRKTQWMKRGDRKEILADWAENGYIEIDTKPTKTKPITIIRKHKKAVE